jgi:hypothetical protein
MIRRAMIRSGLNLARGARYSFEVAGTWGETVSTTPLSVATNRSSYDVCSWI